MSDKKAKSQKPKRTHAKIRSEKESIISEIQRKIDAIDKWCKSAKVPKLVIDGSHQDAVEFKELLEKNQNIPYPSKSLKKSPAKNIQARLDTVNGIYLKFSYFFGEM